MNDAVKKFIMTVSAFFPRQKFSGEEAKEALWLRSMGEMLGGYAPEVLARAAEDIVKSRDPGRDGTMFPKPAECIAACDAAKKQMAFQATPLLPKQEKADDWSDDRLALAFDLVNGEMGRRAAREGWVSSLYHFARKNMRLPQPNEIAAIVAERRDLEQFIAGLKSKDRPTSVDAALISFAGQVDKRREELVEGVVNGVVENKSWFVRG